MSDLTDILQMSGLTDRERVVLAITPDDWGNIVRDRRVELGLSQGALAEKIGMSRQWVVRFENGNAAVATVDHLTRIADALDLEIDVSGA